MNKNKISAKHCFCISIVLISVFFLFTACTSSKPAQTASAVKQTVTIDTTIVSRTVISGDILGGNMGAWISGSKLNDKIGEYYMALGSGIMRFPGGNISNNYCWVTQKVADNKYTKWDSWSWGTNLKQYASFIKKIGCAPMFCVNPFDHTINGEEHSAVAEAENIIKQLKDYGLSGTFYFEVGNENDGSWNRQLSIAKYTEKFMEIAAAMKAEDSSVKLLGPVVSGFTNAEGSVRWIDGFINRLHDAGKLQLLDYLSYHHYGGWISNSNSDVVNLKDPQSIGTEVAYIRSKLDQWGQTGIKIALTEYNAAIWDNGCTRDQFTIRQALWIGDIIGELFRHIDIANIWIALHPGKDPHTLIDDATQSRTKNYWPAYLAAKTLGGTSPSEQVSILGNITSSAGTNSLSVHAVKKADNSYGILLVNKAPSKAVALTLSLTDIPAVNNPEVLVLSETEYKAGSGPVAGKATAGNGSLEIILPPYSLTGVMFK